MMPLVLADTGNEYTVIRVGGDKEVKQHLADMGFVPGSVLTIVTKMGGNIIINVKDTRVAISREMASKIMV